MHLSENLSDGKLDVTIKPGTNFTAVDGVYADRPDPLTSWLTLQAGLHTVHLRLTWEQLDAMHAVLDALLTDRRVQEDEILRAAGSGDCDECRDAMRGGPGHSDPAEVLADRDPTAPVIEPPSHRATNVRNVNGWDVTFTATDDWQLCVHSISPDEGISLRDLPAWDSYADAVAYLETVLECPPKAVS